MIDSSRFTHLLIDLDDTVYPSSTGIWDMVGGRIKSFMLDVMHFPKEEAAQIREYLLRKYGTTLRGLEIEYGVNTQHYLDYVHDVDLSVMLKPAPVLSTVLAQYPNLIKWIFTNASREHAERVLRYLQLREHFSGIIDITDVMPWCKPYPESFHIAFKIVGVTDPARCIFIDDRVDNVTAALDLGIQPILVSPHPHADIPTIEILEHLPRVLA